MKRMLVWTMTGMLAVGAGAQTGRELPFQKWALTPPMGWNSWDCYGPTVVEDEVKANADYMAEKLAVYGWEYVVVDIRWFVENDKAGGYNQTNPIYVYDEWGRYTPALNRFPSAANGVGFRALADYVHGKGLKFGIHLMRGLPKIAAEKKLPVKGTNGITCDMIASNDSACTWLRDNYKVDYRKPGAQEYYNSCFELYAEWGVDFVKIDDLSRPYHTAEIEMIRKAIDHCGRPIVLSISPGETPLEKVDHVKTHANMWRTVDDFWDNWSQLNYQFQVCAKWAPYIAPGTWPDADMLPLGKISIRGERGEERWTNFTRDEQYTMMNLWTIFKSPLMFGGDLPQNDKATDSLLTNRDVLYMHHYSANNRQLSKRDNHIVWAADDPANGDKFVALFNTGGSEFINTKDALYRSGTISYLTTGYAKDADVDLTGMKTGQLALVVSDDGDGYDSDHADWANPVLVDKDGKEFSLTEIAWEANPVNGWNAPKVNKNNEGNTITMGGQAYDKGFGVNAPSMLTFVLPEGHGYVKFKATVGYDDDVKDAAEGVTVEFRVFTEDPAPGEASPVALDLVQLGFAADQPCRVKEMWKGKDVGTFKNAEFAPILRSHASGLYRVSAVERTEGASVAVEVPSGELTAGEPFEVKITVSGGPSEGAYVQLLCGGEIIGTLPVEADGTARYTATLYGGTYMLQAKYSGTTAVASAVSDECPVTVGGASEDLTQLQQRLQSLVDEAKAIVPEEIAGALRAPLAQAIEKASPIEGKTKAELETAISALVEAVDAARLSIPVMTALQAVVEDATDFLKAISASEAKDALVAAISEGQAVYASEASTVDDIEAARQALAQALSDTKKTAKPVDGQCFDMTEFLVNPSFESGKAGWLLDKQTGGWESFDTWNDRPAHEGSYFISLAYGSITSIDLYQVVEGLPAGVYSVQGALRNTDGADLLTDQHIYAEAQAGTYDSEVLSHVGGENNNDWSDFTVAGIRLGEGESLRLGARSSGSGTTAGWFQADDFRLFYWGTNPSDVRVVQGMVDGVTVVLGEDGVRLTAASACSLPVYTVGGVLYTVWTLQAGTQTKVLPRGQYVVNGKVLFVR